MWILQLTPIYSGRLTALPVAFAEHKEILQAFVNSERVMPYTEKGFVKPFKKGGPLENYHSPDLKDRATSGAPVYLEVNEKILNSIMSNEEQPIMQLPLH